MRRCSVDDCPDVARRRGWCHLHYSRWYRGKSITGRPVKNEPAYERMVARGFERHGECLLFKGMTNSYGYGVLKDSSSPLASRRETAHRISYSKWHGGIPSAMQIDHVCHNRALREGNCHGGVTCHHRRCVNPAHLEAKTIQENLEALKVARVSGVGSICRVIGCGSDWKITNGYCIKHYSRAHRNGHPFTWKSGSRGSRVNLEIHAIARSH